MTTLRYPRTEEFIILIQSSSFPAPPQCLLLPSPPPKRKERGYANRCVLEGKQQTYSPDWGNTTTPIPPSGLSSTRNFATRAPLHPGGALDPAVPGALLLRLLCPRYQAQPKPLPSPRATEEAGKGARRRAGRGWSRNSSMLPRVPGAPTPQFCQGRLGPVRRGLRREGADSPEPAGPRPGSPTCPSLSPESSRVCPAGEGGRQAPETFPHAFPLSPSPSTPPRDPLLPSAPGQLALPWTQGGRRRRQGGGSYLPGKFPTPRRGSPPQGRASGRGQLHGPRLPLLRLPARPLLPQLPQRRLRSGPSPRLARPTPGPHWQRESPPLRVFPKAPSSRAPVRAAPPAPLPAPGCGVSRDPLGRSARTYRRARALRLSAPPLPARSPAPPKGG